MVLYQFYTLIIITTGKPHSHPMHPDCVPSVFPSLYKKSPASGPKLKEQLQRVARLEERSKRNEERVQQEVMETQRTEKQGYREEIEKQVVERMQQLQIQGELLRSKVEVQLDEAEKEFQCVDREPELSNNSKGQGEREGESEGRSDEGLQEVPQTTAGPTPELVQLQSENSDLKRRYKR